MVAFILSNLAGLVRQILVADAFGTGMEIDAFNAANRVSETLFTLVAGGALASAFIPTFTGLLTQSKRSRAWRLASSIANLLLLIVASLGALAALFAPQIVRYILAPGFADHPLQETLTIDLMRLMLPAAVLFSLSGLLMGILNAHQIFFIPALTPSMYQFGMIFGVLVLVPRIGIFGLAWGVLIGAGLHLLLQVPLLPRLRGRYFPTFGLKLASVREVLRLMGPRLMGVAVVQLNFWVNTRLASNMAAGSVTGILFGFTLMLMPQAAIAQSIAVAAMPTFSAQFSLGKLDEMRNSLGSSLRGLLLLSIPASLGLVLLREPLVAALYQRGEFTARSTELVAWALLWYGIGLVGHSVVEILARAFYSLHDTRTPVLVGSGAMILNVVFSFAFSSLFANMGWMPLGGLALANSLATGLEMVGLLVLMRRRLNGLQGERVLPAVFQSVIAALGMSLLLGLWIQLTADRVDWLVALGGVALGGVVYALILFALGNHELRQFTAALLRKLRQIRI
jgi:putative peptidoglycan lipid II flippase